MPTDRERYEAAIHAMQTGVEMKMNYESRETTPKHLRVGVNAAMSDQAGLAELLIAKGVFTEDEYTKAMADAAEREAALYEREINEHFGGGTRITLH